MRRSRCCGTCSSSIFGFYCFSFSTFNGDMGGFTGAWVGKTRLFVFRQRPLLLLRVLLLPLALLALLQLRVTEFVAVLLMMQLWILLQLVAF